MTIEVIDEHDLYPIHEEDSVPQGPAHWDQNEYLVSALRIFRPDVWITCDMCHYWEEGNKSLYRAPDISVIDTHPPTKPPNVYLAWRDAPLLFVAEIASESSIVNDTDPKLDIYEQMLRVPEYLYANPMESDLRLWELVVGRYRIVPPDRNGRVWSKQLGVFFGWDANGFLRMYDSEEERLLSHLEQKQRADIASERAEQDRRQAEQERQRAEQERQRAEQERQRAEQAIQRAEQEVKRADAASQRAEQEMTQRLELERRLSQMAEELERLRGLDVP